MKSYASLLLVFVLAGCGVISKESRVLQEIQTTVQRARSDLQAVERLQVQEKYARDYAEAHNELINAENALADQRQDQAYLAALRSSEASQRIFRQLYQDVIIPSAKEAKINITPPENALQDFVPELNDILDYSDQIAAGQRRVEPAKVLADYDTIKQIGQNPRTPGKALVSEIHFAPGKYDLSPKEQRDLRTLGEGILAAKRQAVANAPAQKIVLTIKVVGYADQMDFQKGGNVQTLTADVAQKLPNRQPERRQFLNQRLSELRAKTIGEYLKQFLSQADQENPPAQIEQALVGLGEEIPPGVSAPYPLSDQRRRVCRLQGSITLH